MKKLMESYEYVRLIMEMDGYGTRQPCGLAAFPFPPPGWIQAFP